MQRMQFVFGFSPPLQETSLRHSQTNDCMLMENLKVSKVEHGIFRFTDVDIRQEEQKIIVSMDVYADSMHPIADFRKGDNSEALNEIELKVFRKYTGKLLWLAENCRPDLSFMANHLSKRSHNATLSDLKYVNKVLKKMRERSNEVVYSRVGDKEELVVRSMSDASYLKVKESVGGSLAMLSNKNNNKTVPLYWKSKRITKICTSTKDVKTHALFRMLQTLHLLLQMWRPYVLEMSSRGSRLRLI